MLRIERTVPFVLVVSVAVSSCVCRSRYGRGLGAGDGVPHDVWRRPSRQDLGH